MHDTTSFPAAIATLVTLLTFCWRERCPQRRQALEAEIVATFHDILAHIDQAHAAD
jgi:hypothetical protein